MHPMVTMCVTAFLSHTINYNCEGYRTSPGTIIYQSQVTPRQLRVPVLKRVALETSRRSYSCPKIASGIGTLFVEDKSSSQSRSRWGCAIARKITVCATRRCRSSMTGNAPPCWLVNEFTVNISAGTKSSEPVLRDGSSRQPCVAKHQPHPPSGSHRKAAAESRSPFDQSIDRYSLTFRKAASTDCCAVLSIHIRSLTLHSS